MYDRPKGNFSFLIAFAKQLAQAIESHRDDDVGIACESLSASLALLDAICGEGPGDDDGGDAEGVDSDDAPGDDTPLGAALRRIAELEQGAPPDVVVTRSVKRLGSVPAGRQLGDGGVRRSVAVLNASKKKGGKRRGKK